MHCYSWPLSRPSYWLPHFMGWQFHLLEASFVSAAGSSGHYQPKPVRSLHSWKVSNTKAPNSSGSCKQARPPLAARWWRRRGKAWPWDHPIREGCSPISEITPPKPTLCLLLWQISIRSTRLKIRVAQPKVKENLKSSDRSKEVGWCWMSVVSEQDGYRQVHMTMCKFFHEFWGSVLGLVLYIFLISMSCFYSTLYQLRKPGSTIFSLLLYNLLGKSHPTT